MSLPGPSAVPAPGKSGKITAVDGILPRELLFEVLLLLPAKEVCRVRAVCPSWRSLTYDLIFIAAHAARHPGPLLAVPGHWRGDVSVDLVELSGDVVKRISTPTRGYGYAVLCTYFDFVIISRDFHSVSMLEPISGSIFAIPHGVGEDLALADRSCYPAWFAMGQVPSTGCYKLLRIVEDSNGGALACELFTFGDGIGHQAGAYNDGIGQWKKVESPQAYLDPSCTSGVVVNGSAYFLFDHFFLEDEDDMETGCIPSFNLETENWSADLEGPFGHIFEESDGMLTYNDLMDRLSLGEIEGCLVIVHCNDQMSTTNLWVLIDIENNAWSKNIIIQNEVIARDVTGVQVLWLLDEGKMILLVQTKSGVILQIYDPTSNTARNVFGTDYSAGVGIYTKSLLLNC